MTDTPATNPGEQPEKPKRTPGDVNQKQIDAINKARAIAVTATQPEYNPDLINPDKGGIPPGQPNAIIGQCDTAVNSLAPNVTTTKQAKELATDNEKAARADLMAGVRKMQGGVRRKFPDDDAKYKAYYIGDTEFDSTRGKLEAASQTMIDLAAGDALPGVTATVLDTDRTLRTNWIEADNNQRLAEGEYNRAVDALKKAEKSVTAMAREIQIAADTLWPYTNPANASIRRTFDLPADRPYVP